MYGMIFPIIAGILISLQSVIQTRISEKIGLWETNTMVHIGGLVMTLLFLWFQGDCNWRRLPEVNPFYYLCCFFGAFIIFGIIKGVTAIGPTLTSAILLITQLIVACLIDCTGSFGVTPSKLDFTKLAGIGLMIGGIIVFRLKG